jgi:[acyl-carrier-protein] S-malonyltransferase
VTETHRQDACATISARLVEQVTSSVLWEKSMRNLLAQGFTRFIEFGPGTALSGFMKRIDKSAQMLNVADVASLETTMKILKGCTGLRPVVFGVPPETVGGR